MRLIDADALVNKWKNGFYRRLVETLMDDAPTIDAVPVVRCKDCRRLVFSDFYGECGMGYLGIVNPWDYCSHGRRKEAEP